LPEYGPPPLDDGTYEIDRVVSAEKRKGKWYLMIKWRGYAQLTEEPRSEIYKSATAAVRREIERAIKVAGMPNRSTEEDDHSESDSDESDVAEPTPETRALDQNFRVSTDCEVCSYELSSEEANVAKATMHLLLAIT
jgi:hypothetical protein